MASRGRGRRGRPRGASQAPPVFDQEAFIDAMGAAIATSTQADAARGQGGVPVTSRGSRPIIFRCSREEGTRW